VLIDAGRSGGSIDRENEIDFNFKTRRSEMAIKVMDSRRFNIVPQVSNIPTQKEVVMSKVNAIVVKQVSSINPKQEVTMNYKQMYQQALEQVISLKQEVKAMAIRLEPKEVTAPLSKKEVYTRTHHHPRAEVKVLRVNAKSVEEVAPIKVKADMHAAGVKAYATRIHNQMGWKFQEVAKSGEVGKVFSILIDEGLPTEKTLRAKYDSRSGRLHSFRVKVEKRLGKPDYSFYYLPISIQL
jgi:hypothetical protein